MAWTFLNFLAHSETITDDFDKCIKYDEAEHEIFLQKLFILGGGILILIFIGSIIGYCRTHACLFEYGNGQVVLEVLEVPNQVPTHSESKTLKMYIREVALFASSKAKINVF